MARSRPDKSAQVVESLLDDGRRARRSGDLFEAQAAMSEAMRLSHQSRDYGRMAVAVEELGAVRQEIRRSAAKARRVIIVADQMPEGADLKPGCYVVEPPRVGIDGRTLRELAGAARVPALVVVREPATRAGLWPVVALGPTTVRTRIKPPGKAAGKRGASKPTPTWVQGALDALGQASLVGLPEGPAAARVDAIVDRLATVPESADVHEELRLACLAAAEETASG